MQQPADTHGLESERRERKQKPEVVRGRNRYNISHIPTSRFCRPSPVCHCRGAAVALVRGVFLGVNAETSGLLARTQIPWKGKDDQWRGEGRRRQQGLGVGQALFEQTAGGMIVCLTFLSKKQ